MQKVILLVIIALFFYCKPQAIGQRFVSDTTGTNALITKGDSFDKDYKPDSAAWYYQKAINPFKTIIRISTDSTVWATYLTCLIRISKIYVDQKKYAEAQDILDKAIIQATDHFGDLHPVTADGYDKRGYLEGYLNKYNQAISDYQKALSIRKRLYHDDHVSIATTYDDIGVQYYLKGKYTEAGDSLEKAYQTHLALSKIDTQSLAITLNNLAVVYTHTGEYSKALKYHHEILDVRRAIFRETHPLIAASLNNIGSVYDRLKDYSQSLQYHQEALNLYKKEYGNESSGNIALAYNNIGSVLSSKGNDSRAIEYYNQALNIKKKLSEEKDQDSGVLYFSLGIAYRKIGQAEKSMEYLNQALNIYLNLVGGEHATVANIYNSIGKNLEAQGEYDQALKKYQKALSVWLATDAPRVGNAYNNIGYIYHTKNNYNKALSFYHKSLNIKKQKQGINHPDVAIAYSNIGALYQDQENYDEALLWYQKALGTTEENSDKFLKNYYDNPSQSSINPFFENLFLTVLKRKSVSLEQRFEKTQNEKDLIAAASTIYLCGQVIDSLRQAYIQNKDELGRLAKTVYEIGLRVNHKLFQQTGDIRYVDQAFQYSEKSKGLALYLFMLEDDAQKVAGIPDSLLTQEKHLKAIIADLQIRIVENPQDTQFNKLLFKKKREYEQLIQLFERDFTSYYNTKYQVAIKNIPFIQQNLLKGQTSILSYFIGSEHNYVFVITSNSSDLIRLPVKFPLEKLVKDFNDGIYGYWNSGKESDDLYQSYKAKYIESANQLYDQLIAPIEEKIDLPNRLIILPDEELNLLSFSALLTERPDTKIPFSDYPYLLKDYQISYCYTATLLDKMSNHQVVNNQVWTGFAPSFFAISNDPTAQRAFFKPLKHTEDEIRNIKKIVSGRAFIGEHATLENFLLEIKNSRFIHLATHAIADSISPNLSCLAFFSNDTISEQNLLRMADIYNMNLSSEMIVLSACETGSGKVLTGEGVASLARAFTSAGSKNITATLWSIYDQSSYLIMVRYYELLQQGLSKDRALKASQLAYLTGDIRIDKQRGRAITDIMKHPYYWAAFVTIGDIAPIALENPSPNGLWIYFWILLVSLIILYLWHNYT